MWNQVLFKSSSVFRVVPVMCFWRSVCVSQLSSHSLTHMWERWRFQRRETWLHRGCQWEKMLHCFSEWATSITSNFYIFCWLHCAHMHYCSWMLKYMWIFLVSQARFGWVRETQMCRSGSCMLIWFSSVILNVLLANQTAKLWPVAKGTFHPQSLLCHINFI